MDNPLQTLKVDVWYKAIAALGAAVTLSSIVAKVHVADNATIFVLGLGLTLLGLGEWTNHPKQSGLIDHYGSTYKRTTYDCDFSGSGCLLDLIGVVLVGYATYRLVQYL